MLLMFEKMLRHRKPEIILTITLFIFAISLILIKQGSGDKNQLVEIGNDLGFSILVALIVRWLTVVFSDFEMSEYTDGYEYQESIQNAHKRIWIYQTWLPGIQKEATQIIETKVPDVRVLLLSFKDDSPIYSRIKGRNISIERAKHNIANSTDPFVQAGMKDYIRFNHDHHPGWITVIDSWVFWGPTPVDRDSHTVEYLFRKHRINSREGEFWRKQFELLWSDNHSHEFDVEKQYNRQL